MRVQLRDGVRLFVDVDGAHLRPDGPHLTTVPTLVVIHGGPGWDHAGFRPYFSRFTDAAQVVYYDHRGMGRSDGGSPSQWNLATWADDLDDLLRTLGIERPVLLGQSFGGYVALRYAISRSDRIAGLILSSTAARWVSADALAVFARLGGDLAKDAAAAFFSRPEAEAFAEFKAVCMPHYTTTPQDAVAQKRTLMRPDVLFHFWQNEHRTFDLRDGLNGVACPVMVVVGAEDPITPPVRSEEIVAALTASAADLHAVAGAGHGVYRDRPDIYEELVRRFIASTN